MKPVIYAILFLASVLNINAQFARVNVVPGWDKIPVKAIHRIYQDNEGYMWYGTFGGLFRYDGYSFKSYRSDFKTPGLFDNNYITNISEDKRGHIWVGTIEGLYRIDKHTDSTNKIDLKGESSSNIFTISVTDDGRIWASTLGRLYELSADGEIQNTYIIPNNRGAYFVYLTPQKELIVSLEWMGMHILKDKKFLPYHQNEKYRFIERIIRDNKHGCYWLATWENGIVKFMPDKPAGSEYAEQPLPANDKGKTTARIFHMVQDDNNHDLWATTWNGLCSFRITQEGNLEQKDIPRLMDGDNPALYDIVKDNKGNLWVSSLDSKSFVISFQESKLQKQVDMQVINSKIAESFGCIPSIDAMCIDRGGTLWINQTRRGIILNRSTDKKTLLFPLSSVEGLNIEPNSFVPSIEPNSIWAFNTWGTWICRMTQEGDKVKCTQTAHIVREDGRQLKTNQIIQTTASTLVLASEDGLYEYDINKGKSNRIKSVDGNIICMQLMSDSHLWFASDKNAIYSLGADKLNETPRKYILKKKFSRMAASSDGRLWIGTNDGELLMLDTVTGNIEDFSHKCDMNGDMVVSVQTDQFNHVWIATDHQLKEYNPISDVYRIHNISNDDIQMERIQTSVSDGQNLYFAGNGGLIYQVASHNLESIPDNIIPHITSIFNHGERVHGYTLPSNASNIEISLSTLNILNSKYIRYAYRMEGVDNDWVYLPMGENTAFYNSLPKGKHKFEVKATDDNGMWSTEAYKIKITRQPYWWETWWAYMVYVISLITALVFTIIKYKEYVSKKQEELLFDTKELIHMKQYAELEVRAKENTETEEFVQLDKMFVDKAEKIVKKNISNVDFDINSFAWEMNMSKSTLNRKIKVLTGKTPLEFIKDIKMEQASKMLLNKTATVQDVIAAIGYNDYKNFVSTFKKTYGMSPTEWQKSKSKP